MPTDFQNALTAAVPGGVRFDEVTRALYATDASVYQIMPTAVVVPENEGDVIATLDVCRQYRVPITARGGGTSQAGQAIGEGVQLDFSKHLNRILEINPDRQTVRVQPGIVLDELNAQLANYGLQLPLDLSTSNRATLGGMIANNSAGTRSVIYGKTIDYVQSLRVLLASGDIVELNTLNKDEWREACQSEGPAAELYRRVDGLASLHAAEIDRRYPKILRRVGGYNLDRFTPDHEQRNLSHILVGSEGTLGLVLDATLKLVKPPAARTLCVVHFDELLNALAAVPMMLGHNPSAVELVDRFILDSTRGKPAYEPLRGFIQGDPGAVMIVEFFGENPDEAQSHLEHFERALQQDSFGYHVHRAVSAAEQAQIWQLRRAALGLSMSARGDAKAISFVEDSAVDPRHLRDYIERFLQILDKFETKAGFYAHASVGLLHIRPVVDLKTPIGVERFQNIASEVADLVLEFGGAMSGEHGDGLVRAPFQQRMFGETLYEAFRQIKAHFDPDGLLNPGKIVDAADMTDNLRFGREPFETPSIATTIDFSDFGGLSRAAEQCGGVGACRKTLTGTMCPSYMATRNEVDSTRGRANVLRMAIHGQLKQPWHDAQLLPVMDLCLECKACKTECPTGVDLARMKSEFLSQHYRHNGVPWRVRWLAHVDSLAKWGSRFAPLSNWLARLQITRNAQEKLLGVDARRMVPSFAWRTLRRWWDQHVRPAVGASVVLFADTFTNYHEPQHGIAFAQLAERLGEPCGISPNICCGRPLISKGLLDEARQRAVGVVQALKPSAKKGTPIVFVEPGCYSAVVDDYIFLVPQKLRDDAKLVAAACQTAEQWLADRVDRLDIAVESRRLLVHGHCHYKALVGMDDTKRLFSGIANVEAAIIDSGCCGMAGSFGYEKEHYDVSQSIGELRLFPAIRESPDATIVAHGFSCRHQIAQFTDANAKSPVQLVAEMLKAGTS